jgi:hypothetical protein
MDILARYLGGIQKNLENLLTEEQWQERDRHFQIETSLQDLQHLSLGLPDKLDDRVIIVFSRLISFFNAGILLYRKQADRKNETWIPGVAFSEGSYCPLPDDSLKQMISLPRLSCGEIKKASPYLILQPLKLNHLSDGSESSALIFKVSEHFLYTLYSQLPEPWLRTQVETIFAKVQMAIVDGIK